VQMLIGYRAQLKSLYASGLAAPEMRSRKAALLHRLEQDYRRLRAEWGNHPIYDDWFRKTPNNAMLAPVALYTEYVPAFEALLEREGRDLPKFYKAVKALAALPQAERIARLNALADAKR